MAEPVAAPPAAGRRPPPWALLVRQVHAQNRLFWRNPFSAFFTLAFPLIFLLLFNSLNGGSRVVAGGTEIRFAQFFTPSILVFAAISACYTNLATSVAINRDEGILKRVRGTPLPPAAYIASRIVSATWFAIVASVIMVTVGVALFHVQIVWHKLPAAAVTLLVGSACFCALGLAVASLAPNGESAPAVANFTILPLVFISGIFFPLDNAPRWLNDLASVFPVKPFAEAMVADFNPLVAGSGFRWGNLGMLVLWMAIGAAVAVRTFQWEPRLGATRTGRRRRARRTTRRLQPGDADEREQLDKVRRPA